MIKFNDNTSSARMRCLTAGSAGGRSTTRSTENSGSSSFTDGSTGSGTFLFCKTISQNTT